MGRHEGLYLRVTDAGVNVQDTAGNLGRGLGVHLKPSAQGPALHSCASPHHYGGMCTWAYTALPPKWFAAITCNDEIISRAKIHSLF